MQNNSSWGMRLTPSHCFLEPPSIWHLKRTLWYVVRDLEQSCSDVLCMHVHHDIHLKEKEEGGSRLPQNANPYISPVLFPSPLFLSLLPPFLLISMLFPLLRQRLATPACREWTAFTVLSVCVGGVWRQAHRSWDGDRAWFSVGRWPPRPSCLRGRILCGAWESSTNTRKEDIRHKASGHSSDSRQTGVQTWMGREHTLEKFGCREVGVWGWEFFVSQKVKVLQHLYLVQTC